MKTNGGKKRTARGQASGATAAKVRREARPSFTSIVSQIGNRSNAVRRALGLYAPGQSFNHALSIAVDRATVTLEEADSLAERALARRQLAQLEALIPEGGEHGNN